MAPMIHFGISKEVKNIQPSEIFVKVVLNDVMFLLSNHLMKTYTHTDLKNDYAYATSMADILKF